MLDSVWFGFTLLALVVVTLLVCVTVLFLILKGYNADQNTSKSQTILIKQISDRHEHMISILASLADEFLRIRQERTARKG